MHAEKLSSINKTDIVKLIQRTILLILLINVLFGQLYIPADPFNILFTEKYIFEGKTNSQSLMFRPFFLNNKNLTRNWLITFRSELFYNTNAPNLENTSDKWIGRGFSTFNGLNISYRGKFISGSVEPFFFINQNLKYYYPVRTHLYKRLNDNPAHSETPYYVLDLRETQFYLHYKGLGIGWSNANMWWGSGIHSSLMMTNNTTGFGHIMLGTLNEKKFGNVGINTRYIFTKLDKKNLYKPFYNALAVSLTYYSNTIITVGLTKAVIAGGTHPEADSVSWSNAPFLIFSGNLFAPKDFKSFLNNWHNDDQTITAYFEAIFPKSKLKLFLEVGRNDIAWDIYNLILAPDHSIATLIGIRKYEIFNISELFFGMEYFRQLYGKYDYRLSHTGPWNRGIFDYSSFNGRYWGPHSGTDSDDFYVYLGWDKNDFSVIYSFNYERHGLQKPKSILETNGVIKQPHNGWPETKIEFKFDFRYNLDGYKIYFILEKEIVLNFEFADKTRYGTVWEIGIEADINRRFIDNFRNKIF